MSYHDCQPNVTIQHVNIINLIWQKTHDKVHCGTKGLLIYIKINGYSPTLHSISKNKSFFEIIDIIYTKTVQLREYVSFFYIFNKTEISFLNQCRCEIRAKKVIIPAMQTVSKKNQEYFKKFFLLLQRFTFEGLKEKFLRFWIDEISQLPQRSSDVW